jgi:hypothetical protein
MKKVMTRLTACLLAIVLTTSGTYAQQNKNQLYTLVSISENAADKFDELYTALAAAKTMNEARNIVRDRNLKNAILKLYISEPGTPKRYWKIDTKTDVQSLDKFRVLRSKGTERINIARLSDFRDMFPDTLLLLNDIVFNISLSEPGYKDAWYTIHRYCNEKESIVAAPKSKMGYFVLSPSVIDCNPYTTIAICNDYNPKRQLRNFVVTQLNSHDNKILEKIAQDFIQDNPGANAETFQDFMGSAMAAYYGHPLTNDLSEWIKLHVSTRAK